jgi:cellulose synthase/poly-beta-1,6-N-acetylglucosamine synthase-like glycosyltransferase
MLESPPTIISSDARAGLDLAAGRTRAPRGGTSVSVVVPCLNEERFIGAVLRNLAGQYDGGAFEIIVVDGMSGDRTRGVIEDFREAHPDLEVRVVDNPARHIPAGVNLGIAAARGEIIVRMDAHSIPSANYVRSCVELLCGSDAAVVGMPWRIRASTDALVARAIALAVAHPFGIGDAKYRAPGQSAPLAVDTVPFGVFRKKLWQELGGFNEELLANEDYDFNYRVRQRGGRVLLDPSGHSIYFARPTLGTLARQYFRYGRWKAQMVKLHPRSIRWRHLVAPAFVVALVGLGALGVFWTPALHWLLLPMLGLYALLALACSVQLARRGNDFKLMAVLPFIFFLLHSVWGSGFLLGLLRAPRPAGDARRKPEAG